jgi:HSP20 family protein
MTLYLSTPAAVMEARHRMMRRLFEEKFDNSRVMSFPVDLSETDESYTLKAFLPGLTAEDVNIQYNNDTLVIDGEYKAVEDEKSEKLVSEFPVGRFGRSFELSAPIKEDQIEATMSNGILTIRVPKAEEAKPRTIKIVAK